MIEKYDATNPLHGYNSSAGGFAGHFQSEESRRRISQFKAGVSRPRWIIERMRAGYKHPEHLTEEHCAHISQALMGHKISDETKAKISERNLNKRGRRVVQYRMDGTEVAEYPSVNEATRQTGIHAQSIGQTCLNKRKSAGGYIWRYVDGRC